MSPGFGISVPPSSMGPTPLLLKCHRAHKNQPSSLFDTIKPIKNPRFLEPPKQKPQSVDSSGGLQGGDRRCRPPCAFGRPSTVSSEREPMEGLHKACKGMSTGIRWSMDLGRCLGRCSLGLGVEGQSSSNFLASGMYGCVRLIRCEAASIKAPKIVAFIPKIKGLWATVLGTLEVQAHLRIFYDP